MEKIRPFLSNKQIRDTIGMELWVEIRDMTKAMKIKKEKKLKDACRFHSKFSNERERKS